MHRLVGVHFTFTYCYDISAVFLQSTDRNKEIKATITHQLQEVSRNNSDGVSSVYRHASIVCKGFFISVLCNFVHE